VLNPRWLCGSEFLGKLLGDKEHLPCSGLLSVAHVTDRFPHMDVADSTALLTALELCSVVTAGSSYQLSCRNLLPVSSDDHRSELDPPCVGGVAMASDSAAHLRYVFPRVQHAIWNSPLASQPSEWNGGIRFRRSSESDPDSVIDVQLNTEHDEDLIRIICRGHDPETLHRTQQWTAAIILRVIDTCCPGVYLQLRALSPRDIRTGQRSPPRAYAAREVASAQMECRDEVRIGDDEDGETLSQVLAFGDARLHATLCPGVELHVSELSMYSRCRLATLLDPPHPHGRDWLLLALGLGLGDVVPQLDASDRATLSRTDSLLALWSGNPDATIRNLLDVVRRTLQRPDVEEILLQLTPLCRPSSLVCPEESHACPSSRNSSIPVAAEGYNHLSQPNSPSTLST